MIKQTFSLKIFLFIFIFLLFSLNVYAEVGIGGGSKYGIGGKETSDISSAVNYSTVSVNDSQFLRGYEWSNAPYPSNLYSTYNASYVTYINYSWKNLTENNSADNLHWHSKLSANDSSPNPALQVDSNGNVGIGIAIPTSKLHIDDASTATLLVKSGTRKLQQEAYASDNVYLYTYGSPFIVGTHDANEIQFWTNWGEKMRIKTTGEVGIGNTDPTYMVDVNTASNTGIRAKSTNAGGESQTIAWNDADKYVTMKQYGSNIGGTLFGVTRNNLATIYNVADNFAIGNYFDTPFILGTNNTEYARINAGGNIGIRTTTPRQALDVAGNITASNYYIRSGDNTYSGRLVDGGTYLTLDAYNGNDWTSRNMRIQGNEVYFLDGATTEVMRIKNGIVGIGTNHPFDGQPNTGTGKLEINGANDGTALLRLYNSDTGFDFARNNLYGFLSIQGNQGGYNDIILAPTSGKVGIKNIFPATDLDVNGSAIIRGNLNVTGNTLSSGNYSSGGTMGLTGSYNCTSFPNVTIKGGIITAWSC